jgi:hypothetical protein
MLRQIKKLFGNKKRKILRLSEEEIAAVGLGLAVLCDNMGNTEVWGDEYGHFTKENLKTLLDKVDNSKSIVILN